LRRVILAICATAAALALLLSFKTHTQSAPGESPAAALGTPAPGTASGAAASAAAPESGGAETSGAGGAGAARTVTGDEVNTIYGPVQVKITVSGGKVSAAAAVEYPTESPRDYQINSFAIPQLNSEAVAAGSAHIDAVSGASYTSQGYIGSLQSALDKAGIS
jgi:uncharacterized protein with FMN-binding domain